MRVYLLILLTFMICGSDTRAQERTAGFVVAELFTSQSCAFCPAADEVLDKIAKNSNVIALSCHVTYWDHLDWKDTLSKKFCTSRQRDYGDNIKGSSRIYTPQLIINGQAEMIGSDKVKVINAISTFSKNGIPVITLAQSGDDILEVTMPNLSGGPFEVFMMGVKNKHVENIASGENQGRTVTYRNIVRDIRQLSDWNGAASFVAFNMGNIKKDADQVVILAQNKASGHMVAAGRLIF